MEGTPSKITVVAPFNNGPYKILECPVIQPICGTQKYRFLHNKHFLSIAV
jgi:hypothetical protein